MTEVLNILDASGAEPWFKWSIEARASRQDVRSSMQWIAANMARDAIIFETGCGCGANLIWLGQKKFVNLSGCDASQSAIAAARSLATLAELQIAFWQDDALAPKEVPNKFDLLIALNWVYLCKEFDLNRFLLSYRGALSVDGVIIMDIVDAAFNQYPRNQYLTDDWHLPQDQQRPTQYKIRMTRGDVARISDAAGFEVLAILPGSEVPPRFVTVMKRR